MKKIFTFWPFFLIFIIVSIFFYPILLQNKVALPADITVGVYYPWLDYKFPGYPTGIPVKNPITTDVVSFMFPMQMLAVDILKTGQIPLWNNLILSGTPLLANFQSAPFSPTNFVYWLLPKLDAWNLQIYLQLFLASIFTYFLLREFKRSKLASVAGGIFYSFSGFLMIWMQWNGHSLTAGFLPLVILLVLKYLKGYQIKWGVFLSVSLALQIFSGYPQIILYQFMALLLLSVVFNKQIFTNFKQLLSLGFFILLGIGLAAIQILPGFELLSLSQRGVEDVLNVGAFLPWQQVITFIAPDYFGNHATFNYWGSGDYTLSTGFSGTVVFVLAGLGFLTFRKEKSVKFAAGLVMLALLIALPNPISLFLKNSGLLGLQAASAHRALFLMNLGMALLAAFGMDSLKTIFFKNIIRSFIFPGILLVGFGLVTIYLINSGFMADHLKIGLKNLIFPMGILSVTFCLLVLQLRLKKFNKFIPISVLTLAIFELFRFGWKFTPFIDRQLVFPETPVIKFLESQQKPFRVSSEDVIPINMLMNYGIETTEGYDAVYPINYAKFLGVSNSGDLLATPMGRYGSITNYDSPLLDIANTKYILALKRDANGKPDISGSLPKKFQDLNLKPVFTDKTVVVLENIRALPRVKLFFDYDVVLADNDQLGRLIDKSFASDEKLILDTDPGILKPDGQGTAEITEEVNQKLVQVNTNKDGLLFIADSLYPGWKAYVDNKETKIHRADFNFMVIPVTPGSHKVEIVYQPDSFTQGKMISLISGAILVGLALLSRLNKYA